MKSQNTGYISKKHHHFFFVITIEEAAGSGGSSCISSALKLVSASPVECAGPNADLACCPRRNIQQSQADELM